jgi:hypothetical protein
MPYPSRTGKGEKWLCTVDLVREAKHFPWS